MWEIGDFAISGGVTPFDIFNQYEEDDQMLDVDGRGCPRYKALRDLLKDSEEYKNLTSEYELEVNPLISKIVGFNLSSYE